MSFNGNVKETKAGESRSSSVAVVGLRCLARVAAPQLGLSRVRLSVTEPRCCFPCLGKRREVASFRFKEEDWAKVPDGQYENCTAYSLVDFARLQRINEDLPVKVKWWAGRRKGKTRLPNTLGDVLQLFLSCSHLTLQVVAGPQQVSVCWAATDAEVTDGTVEAEATHSQNHDEGLSVPIENTCTFINNDSGRIITLPAHYEAERSGGWTFPGAWTSRDDELDDEDLKLVSALSGASSFLPEKQQRAIQKLPFHTYINNSSGRFITLPVHEEEVEGWNFPGAWTSEVDVLDEDDLRLINALNGPSY